MASTQHIGAPNQLLRPSIISLQADTALGRQLPATRVQRHLLPPQGTYQGKHIDVIATKAMQCGPSGFCSPRLGSIVHKDARVERNQQLQKGGYQGCIKSAVAELGFKRGVSCEATSASTGPQHEQSPKSEQVFEQPPSQSFDPLSLTERASNLEKRTVIFQLAATVCIAIIVASRQPLCSSSLLCLSLSTAPQTGPSFHPLVHTAWTGLVTGCLHTMTGPDHLASLAPLTIGRSRAQSALLGALWGAGHGSGQLLLGSIFLLFKERIEHLLPLLSRWSSTLVGLILILIGAHGLHESLLPLDEEAMEFKSYLGTYINGFTFGLQPDALMMILPALALPSRVAAASFLGAFLLGTIGAMGTYSGCIGAASEALGKRMPWLTQRLSQVSGIVAIALGIFFVVTNVLGLSV